MHRFHKKLDGKSAQKIQCNDFTEKLDEKSAGKFKTFILYRFNLAQDNLGYTGTKNS